MVDPAGQSRDTGASTTLLPLDAFLKGVESWLDEHDAVLEPTRGVLVDMDASVVAARNLQVALYDAGWAGYGWPVELGGRGGDVRYRALMSDALARRGCSNFAMFEHLEVLLPTLCKFAHADFLAEAVPEFLSGRGSWAQGFSEPDAGSDLADLRTRATLDATGATINGHKIWTSWAKYATRCLVLARTGSRESRHKGLTMFAVDLDAPGVDIRPIRQPDGSDQLAEVFFDDVRVGRDRIVGEECGGWAVSMDVLLHERGSFSWFRQCTLLARVRRLIDSGNVDSCPDAELGRIMAELAAVRASAAGALRSTLTGRAELATASYAKLLLSSAEQSLYDVLADSVGARMMCDALPDSAGRILQQDYLFSRIVTIYGGSQQMQLNGIAKQVLGL